MSVLLLGLPLGLMVGVGAAPVAHRAARSLDSAAARRRSERLGAQLPAALDLMVSALEVGRPVVTAFALAAEATAAPLGPELAAVAGRLAIAGDPHAVWAAMEGEPSLAAVGRTFRRAETTGMPVARIVSAVADDLRREQGGRRRELARRAGVRTTAPLAACFLPAFFLIGIVPTVMATFRTFTF